MNPIHYTILFSAIFLGGAAAFQYREKLQGYLPLMLSFSGAYIVGITALHLIPETFHEGEHYLGLCLLAGFLGQLLLDQLTTGVEHGHIHAAHTPNLNFVIKIMIGLCIHSFLEGMPLNQTDEDGFNHHQHLLWGIILHEIPASFTLTSLLLISSFKKSFTLFCLFIYASMSSLGALTTAILPFSEQHLKILMAFVIGTFLHISTTILFEADSGHRIASKKLLAIVLGTGIAILTMH
jgi:zinc transporter ZupT